MQILLEDMTACGHGISHTRSDCPAAPAICPLAPSLLLTALLTTVAPV